MNYSIYDTQDDDHDDAAPAPATCVDGRYYNPRDWTSVPQPCSSISEKTTINSTTRDAIAMFQSYDKNSSRMNQDVWDHRISDAVKIDRQQVAQNVAGLEHGAIIEEAKNLPWEMIQNDKHFWLSLLRKDFEQWWKVLPSTLQDDVEFAKSVLGVASRSSSRHVFLLVLERFPALRKDNEVWLNAILSGNVNVDLITEMADDDVILQNKQLMLEACKRDYKVYDALCSPLNRNRDIVHAALQNSPAALYYIPAVVQDLYPDLIAQAIRQSKTHHAEWLEYIGANQWKNRIVVAAWLSIGGVYLQDRFPVSFRNDKELFLIIAEANASEFCKASFQIRSDKDFMLQAIQLNGRLLLDAENGLDRDMDLALMAFSSMDACVALIDAYSQASVAILERQAFLYEFWNHIQNRIQEFANLQLVMDEISSCNRSSCLEMLDQGHETSDSYKARIAAYIGIPNLQEIKALYLAKSNLSQVLPCIEE